MIQTIIFDLGGVLIKWDPKLLYRKIFPDEKEMNMFLSEVCTMDWNEQQDAGRTWKDGIAELTPKYPQYEREINAYFRRWPEMLGGAIHETVVLLEQLKASKKYRLYALTNWSAETFPFAQRQFSFLQHFEGILVSGEEKLKKPDPKIYQLLFSRYSIDPATALFIDDSLRNIKAAEQVGLQVHHFTESEKLRVELKRLLTNG